MDVEYENGKFTSVAGNACPRGKVFARNEIENPMRIVTSTVKVDGGAIAVVPVKTAEPINRDLIFKVMDEIKKAKVQAPVSEGQVILENPANCKTDVVATFSVLRPGRRHEEN
jgi:CxxC motif-containing protein